MNKPSFRPAPGLSRSAARGWAFGLLASAVLLILLWPSQPLLAGPVDWQEVPSTSEGRQWWDSGSLRRNRRGLLTVLSRFQPAEVEGERRANSLFVMELDCDQRLYRDTAVNGLPHWGAAWQPAGEEDLTASVLNAVCAAGAELTVASR